MNQEKITSLQIIFIILNTFISSVMVSNTGIEVQQDIWLANLLGIALSLGFALIYVVIAKRFPGQTLIAINDIVWGSFFGKIVSLGYLLFFLLMAVLRVDLIVSFQKGFFPATPPAVFTLMTTGMGMLMVIYGLELIARCNLIIRMMIIPFWLILVLLNLPSVELSNFQPFLQTPFPKIIKAALRVSAMGFSTGYAFLMIFPAAVEQRRLYQTVSLAFAATSVYLMTGILFTIGTLGPSAGYFAFPLLSASRLINVADVFTRMEILNGIISWLGYMMTTALAFYILVSTFSKLFKLKAPQSLALPFLILISILNLQMFTKSSERIDFFLEVWTLLTAPFQYLLPLLTLIMAFIRKPLPERAN